MKTLAMLLCSAAVSSAMVAYVNPWGPEGLTIRNRTTFQLMVTTMNGPEFIITEKAGEWLFERPWSGSNKNAQLVTFGNCLALLASGDIVSNRFQWSSHSYLGGEWEPNGVPGFIGILSNPEDDGDPAKYHAGWLRMAWNPDRSITLYEWAYQDRDGVPIRVGDVPEFKTAHLILLSISLLFCLRRTRTKPTP